MIIKRITLFSIVVLLSGSSKAQMAFTKIQVYNEYDTLKEVVVGIADTLYFPDSHEIDTEEKATFLSKMLSKFFHKSKGKKVPNWVAKKYQKEEKALVKVLKDYNIVVHRVDYVCPLDNEPLGLGQMYARDPVISVGNVILNSKLQIPLRHKENRGFKTILKKLNQNGITIQTPPADDIYLEGGDVIVNHPYIFVGHGKYGSNKKGIEWLKTITKGKFEVIPVEIVDSSILHLDCSMTIIGNKKGIINRKSLESPLPFPLNEYNFYDVTAKTRKQLGTNVLVINPTTVIVQKRHRRLRKALSEDGYKIIPIKFTWHTFLGGSFRCATCPLVRLKIKE